MPSNIERVARSHSATTKMSPLPSSSRAFSSSDLPLEFCDNPTAALAAYIS